MIRSMWIVTAACAIVAGTTSVATGAQIDPELRKLLDERNKSEIIPVLMVFPDEPAIDEFEVPLDGTPATKRRNSAIAALKREARKAQTDAWAILEDPNHPGVLAYADMLYFSNAIAFGGDADIILAVAGDKSSDAATLFYDKNLDLLSGAAAPTGGAKAAEADTTWNLRYIRADRVWTELGITGAGIIVGHLDTGVDLNHPDLRHRIWTNPLEVADNGIDDDGNGFVDDVHGWDFGDDDAVPRDDALIAGHGTHTAGTVVGDGSGGVQTGVAPGAYLLPVKIFTTGGTSSLGRIWAAQQYCAENGARIITMSLGIKGEIPAAFLRNDRFNAEALRAAGVVVFNSAGNYHEEFNPPLELGMTARIPAPWNPLPVPRSSTGGVITVGGTEHESDAIWAQSSQGPAGWDQVDPWFDWPYVPGPGLIKPDVVAPAVGITSTLPDGSYSGDTWAGTSMACPQAAGVAALMLEKNPTLSPAGIDSVLERSAVDLGAPGKDPVFGSGLIDAYAAVQAVPADQLPDLAEVVFHGDPNGNRALDPGEIAAVVFDVRNAGLVAATGVTGRLTVLDNPHVGVSLDTSAFPDIAAGGSASNTAIPFRLAISPLAPQGHSFVMYLTLSTAEGFERRFDVTGYVGLPEFRTHDVGKVYLTATSRGSLGYLSDARLHGQGMGLIGDASSLFMSSLWAGSNPADICNNDFTAEGADPAEWRPRLQPTGNVAVSLDSPEEQVFAMAFNDSGLVHPRGIVVELTSHGYSDPAREDVVVLDYLIRNMGQQPFNQYYAGLFVDFDVVDAFGNTGGVDPGTRSVWIGVPDGPVYGVAVCNDAPTSNLTLVDNPTYVFPFNHVIGVHKYQLLNGSLQQSEATEPTDLAALAAAGPFALDPGDAVRVRFVLAYGADLAAFLANVAAAGSDAPVSNVEPDQPTAPVLSLGQNVPNPFNPSTVIGFSLAARGPVELAVFDLAGRRIRTLVSEDLAAGAHVVRWDGRDDRGRTAGSGIYVYKLATEGRTLSRKMILVK